MTNKDAYLKLWKRGKVSINKLRDKAFPCTLNFDGAINPVCYRFLRDEGEMSLIDIEELYYSYVMEFVKKKYPERVFALWMTEN